MTSARRTLFAVVPSLNTVLALALALAVVGYQLVLRLTLQPALAVATAQ